MSKLLFCIYSIGSLPLADPRVSEQTILPFQEVHSLSSCFGQAQNVASQNPLSSCCRPEDKQNISCQYCQTFYLILCRSELDCKILLSYWLGLRYRYTWHSIPIPSWHSDFLQTSEFLYQQLCLFRYIPDCRIFNFTAVISIRAVKTLY